MNNNFCSKRSWGADDIAQLRGTPAERTFNVKVEVADGLMIEAKRILFEKMMHDFKRSQNREPLKQVVDLIKDKVEKHNLSRNSVQELLSITIEEVKVKNMFFG